MNLRQMEALGVRMQGVLPRLVRWARRAVTRDFCPALAALISPGQNIIFLTAHFFHFISPHHSATLPGSRAGSPVSVSLCSTLTHSQQHFNAPISPYLTSAEKHTEPYNDA